MLAGRVLAGIIYKEAFGGFKKIPSILDHHNNMVSKGYWEKLPYSEDEFSKLELEIDHSKDLKMSYPEIKQINDKYVIRDRVKEQSLESPQFMYMGMAMAVMKNMPEDRRLRDVIKYYHYLSDKKICAPTPFMSQLRTPNRGYASCAIFTTNDTAKSLAAGDHIAYMLTCASAGIGAHIKTRSKGAKVRGGTTIHQGKRPYYKMTESAVAANLQNSRGGSATMHVNCLDPEIMEILTWKNKKTATKVRVDGIHYSFGSNNLFAKYVRDNKQWMLVDYSDSPELYEAMYSGDQVEFERLYKEYEKSNKPRNYVPAIKIATEALVQGQESGQVYLHSTDEMNRHTPYKDKIYSSNLCVAPETQILTDQGYIPIAELEDEKVNIWNGKCFTETVVKKTGEDKELWKVVTSSGQELECTPYHKWYVFDGYGKPCKVKRTHELVEGDKLEKFDLPVIEGYSTLDKPYLNGFYTGDGCHFKNKNIVYLYGEKRKLAEEFKKYPHTYYICQEKQDREVFHMENLMEKFFVPNEGYTIESRLEWLAGWLDADGSVYKNGDNRQLVGSSIEKNFLLEVQRMLQTLGVSAKLNEARDAGYRKLPLNDGSGELGDFWCKDAWRLLITSCDVFKLMQLGLGRYLKRLKVIERLPQRDAKQFNKVVSVSNNGRKDDTYCFTESMFGKGIFNGILTGNCQETAFPSVGYDSVEQLYQSNPVNEDGSIPEIGLCSLSAIVARRVDEGEWEDVCYYAALAIDEVLDIMDYPFPSLKTTAQARRNIGVGITDLAGLMAEKKLKYSSLEGKQFIHRLAEHHSYSMIKASVRLAKERGECEWIHKTKWKEGWLPIDTMNKNVYKVIKQPLTKDWESLRKEVMEHGVRFSVVTNFMPNESSSVATNGTNSILPARSLKVVKTNGKKKTRFLAPNVDTHGEFYELAWDIPTKDLIEVYAAIQAFTDQSISSDIYLDFTKGEITGDDLLEQWLYMKLLGMKTRYYVNSKTNTGKKEENKVEEVKDVGCSGGGCSL
ncbi:putative ribonucleoside diphosphate reductase subunit alpha [Vibrio phage VPMCC14]|nr:putative ribonucleoside diphosphate reductase subunit alpha [Vibrio phage VPMCC14]